MYGRAFGTFPKPSVSHSQPSDAQKSPVASVPQCPRATMYGRAFGTFPKPSVSHSQLPKIAA
ncbi:MAG: hypothetical protein K2G35_07825 [Duncaniella sp.]|nr:hypothetical protein [Duncaniella sp.]